MKLNFSYEMRLGRTFVSHIVGLEFNGPVGKIQMIPKGEEVYIDDDEWHWENNSIDVDILINGKQADSIDEVKAAMTGAQLVPEKGGFDWLYWTEKWSDRAIVEDLSNVVDKSIKLTALTIEDGEESWDIPKETFEGIWFGSCSDMIENYENSPYLEDDDYYDEDDEDEDDEDDDDDEDDVDINAYVQQLLLSSLAAKGDAEAQFKLGMKIWADEYDLKRAQGWLEKSAQQGYVDAMTYLALICTDESIADDDKAYEWSQKVVNNNNATERDKATCMRILGEICSGDPDSKYFDLDKAYEWSQKVVNNNSADEQDKVMCMNVLGDIYSGDPDSKYFDLDKAVEWYQKSLSIDEDDRIKDKLKKLNARKKRKESKARRSAAGKKKKQC